MRQAKTETIIFAGNKEEEDTLESERILPNGIN